MVRDAIKKPHKDSPKPASVKKRGAAAQADQAAEAPKSEG
jgi:hypothetical protein